MANDWAPEPWRQKEMTWWISDANDNRIDEWTHDDGFVLPKGTSDRIIACVNACAGVPMEDLQSVLYLGKDILRYLTKKHHDDSAKEAPDAGRQIPDTD